MFTTRSILLYFFFFFSSRRRHTRCLSDWSSDVCSSDLSSTQGALRAWPSRGRRLRNATRQIPKNPVANERPLRGSLGANPETKQQSKRHPHGEERRREKCFCRWK